MADRRWRLIGAGVGAIMLLLAACGAFTRAAGDDDPAGPPPSESGDAPPQQVLVLATGRVIRGDVVERPGGYLVRERFGSVVVPFTQVRLTAANLPDAYRKLSEAMESPTAGQHLELAEWCYDNRLYSSAQEQVKKALRLEPERRDARDLLIRLRRVMETGVVPATAKIDRPLGFDAGTGSAPAQAWKSVALRKRMEAPSEAPLSAAGLSPEVVQTFVRDIQPLLMNKCGNARCHGQAAKNEFRLTPVRLGMSGFRILTEKNLSSVLREIDHTEPGSSRLLSVMDGSHGGSSRLFVGRAAEKQQASLREWVFRAAREQAQQSLVQGRGPSDASDDKEQAKPSHSQDSFLDQILADERPDRFDPAIFNRMMHAGSTDAERSE